MVGCTSFGDGDPYAEALQTLRIKAVYPEGYETFTRSGVRITAEDIQTQNHYTALTDERGEVLFRIPRGHYRLSMSDRAAKDARFNGVLESVRLQDEELTYSMPLIYLKPSSIIFKELYFGGCPKTPTEGTLLNDQYIILHNNDSEVQYLDGICFGSVDPYTSASQMNGWVTMGDDGNLIFQDFAPINEVVWQFQGSGTDFPLQPGEDAVVSLKGAVDFTKEFPLSVNLNKKGYFACHSRLHYSNESQHIAPGDQIEEDHILKVLKKTGKANAFVIAMQSPAVVIFRPEAGFDLKGYLADDSRSVATVPGGTNKCVKAPWDWVLDGVEVFYSINNNKRIPPAVDAAAILFSAHSMGYSIERHVDEEESQQAGYEVLVDTNSSATDFYERKTSSLHE